MSTTPLTTILTKRIDKLHDLDSDWVTFIRDHIEPIKANSRIVAITDADRDRYLHKLKHFLRDNLCNQNIMWIARLINDLNSYENFTTRQSLYIPDLRYITELYRIYRTSRNIITT